jgi:hypothetical protein
MADMGWTARVATAAAASAGTGAAQLGLGYGLGVVVWPLSDTPDDSVWLGSLGWAIWITASATVLGAVIASRLGGGPKPRSGAPVRLSGPWRLTLAAAAAIGALVAVALIALPARSAVRGDTFSPQVIAAGYALLGVLLGLVVAYWAVVSRPVAANLITTGLWLWALAISAVVVDLTLHRSSATYLTSWQFAGGTGHLYGTIFWPSAALTLAAAFVIGIISVAPAARRGHLGLGAATSGAVGPLLVAAAFFVLAPQLTGALGPLESAYLIAPYAVIAGLAGSALTVSLTQAVHTRRATRTAPDRRALPAAPTPADTDRDETPTFADPAPPRTRPGRQRTPEPPTDTQPPTERQRGWRRGQRSPGAPTPTAEDDQAAPARQGRWGRGKQAPARQDRSETTPQAADEQADTTGQSRWRKGDRAARAAALADDQPSSGPSGGWRKGRQNPEAPAADDNRASGTGVATVPAADPATFPPAPAKQKTKLSRLFSRTKVPAQPTADAAPESDSTASPTRPKPSPAPAKSPTEASTQSGAAPKPSTGPSSASRPSPRPSAGSSTPSGASPAGQSSSSKLSADAPSTPPTATIGRPSTAATPTTDRPPTPPTPTTSRPSAPPTPTTSRPPTPPTPTTGRPSTPSKSTAGGSAAAPGKPSAAAASGAPRQTGPGRGENIGSRPVSGKPSDADRADGEASEGADPEIAAAARPRGRSKKAPEPVRRAPQDDKSPQSTVTPPPSSPTIAQINPKPPAD